MKNGLGFKLKQIPVYMENKPDSFILHHIVEVFFLVLLLKFNLK